MTIDSEKDFFKNQDTDNTDFFDFEIEDYTAPPVEDEKAIQRASAMALKSTDPDNLKLVETIASANVNNTQSTEELEMIATVEGQRLEALSNAAESEMMKDPSVENIDAYNTVRDEIMLSGDYYLIDEAGNRELISNIDTTEKLETRLNKYNRWLNKNKEIAKLQAAFDTEMMGTAPELVASTIFQVISILAPTAYTGRVKGVAQEFNPEGWKANFGDSLINLPIINSAMLGSNKEVVAQKFLDADPADVAELFKTLYTFVKQSGGGLHWDAFHGGYLGLDGVSKKLAMEDLLHRINKGEIEGIEWGKYIDNILGLLEIFPFFTAAASRAARSTGTLTKIRTPRPKTPPPKTPPAPPGAPLAIESMVDDIPENYVSPLQDSYKGSSAYSLFDTMNMTNSTVAADILTGDWEQVAKAAGLSSVDVLNRITFKPKGFNPTGMSQKSVDAINGDLSNVKRILDTINPKFSLTANEVQTAIDAQVAASLSNMSTAKRVNDLTDIDFNNKGFIVNSVFASNTGEGFHTLAEAKAVVSSYGGRIEDVEIIHWDPSESTYKNVKAEYIKSNKGDSIIGDFYIASREEYIYSDQTALDLSQENFSGNSPQMVGKAASGFVGYFGGPQFSLIKDITLPASVAADKQSALNKSLGRAGSVFLKANDQSKRIVIQALELGNKEATTYSLDDFMARFNATQKDYDIYGSMRVAYDAIWDWRGTSMSKTLKAKGYRFIYNDKTKESYIARPIETVPSEVNRVWDLELGKAVSSSKAKNVYKLDQEQRFGNSLRTYISMGNKSTSIKISQLPPNVLKYEEGYTEISYKDPYTIYRVSDQVIDGIVVKNYKSVVGSFPGEAAATKALAAYEANPNSYRIQNDGTVVDYNQNLIAGKTPVKYNFIVERRGPADYTSMSDINEHTKWYQPRKGDMMRGLFGEMGPTPTRGAIESLEMTLQNFAKVTSTGPWMDINKARYINHFDNDGDLIVKNSFSPPTEALKNDVGRGRLSKNMYGMIELMGSIQGDRSLLQRGYKSALLTTGRLMESKWSEKAGQYIQTDLPDKSPADSLRGLAFTGLVITHPLRQLIQNPLTALFVSALNPALGAKAFNNATTMMGAMAMRPGIGHNGGPALEAAYKASLSIYAKSLGTDTKTANKFIQAFIDSGLVSDMDARLAFSSGILSANNQVRGSVRNITTVGGMVEPIEASKKLLRGVKKIGFDAGEFAFQAHTASMALLNHMATTGKSLKEVLSSQSDLDMIFGVSRQISGNQNKAGVSQIGRDVPTIMSLLSTGVAHGLAMLLDTGGSLAFSAAVKGKQRSLIRATPSAVKFSLAFLILYGGGENLNDIFSAAEEATGKKMPLMLKRFLVQGAVNSGINATFDLIAPAKSGIESTVDWAQGVNPAYIYSALSDLMTNRHNKGPLEFFLGATGGMGPRVVDTYHNLKLLSVDPSIETTADRLLLGSDIIAEGISKGYFDAKFAAAWWRQQSHFSNKYSSKAGNVTFGNAVGKAAGMKTIEERAEQRYRNTHKENMNDTKELANGMFAYILKRTGGDGLNDEGKRIIKALTENIGAQGPEQTEIYNKTIVNKLKEYDKPGSPLNKMLRKMVKRRDFPSKAVLEKMLKDVDFPEEYKDYAQRMINLYEENEEKD